MIYHDLAHEPRPEYSVQKSILVSVWRKKLN